MKIAKDVASRLVAAPCEKPFQITRAICAASQLKDAMGMTFEPGELQLRDLQIALAMFEHRFYVKLAVKQHGDIHDLLIHQIQKPVGDGFRIFGTLVARADGRYLMHCVENVIGREYQKNREVMEAAKASLCGR